MASRYFNIVPKLKFRFLYSYGFAAIAPSQKAIKITKNDAEDLPDGPCRAIWSKTDGTINVVWPDGSEASDFPIFAGMNQFAVARVKTGGTTSDDIWAVY